MVLGLTPVSANVLAVWPWRRNVITLRLTGFLMMELRNAHAAQGGFRGSVKECIQRAWNQLIHRWCWPLFYCCVCGCQGWWTERTTDVGGGGVGMQVGQEGTSQGGVSGAHRAGCLEPSDRVRPGGCEAAAEQIMKGLLCQTEKVEYNVGTVKGNH